MHNPIETIRWNNKVIQVFHDEEGLNPRDDEPFGTMICFHGRYNLGDKHSMNSDDYGGWAELAEAIHKEHEPVVILPIYLYDHSGLAFSTSPFSCPWDSGQVGFIFFTKKDCKHWGIKDDDTQNIVKQLENEVDVYGKYVNGECYGYAMRDEDNYDDEGDDSCWGFYSIEQAIEAAKEAA